MLTLPVRYDMVFAVGNRINSRREARRLVRRVKSVHENEQICQN
jgi:hypothetical protein